jgi:hypothetical protein
MAEIFVFTLLATIVAIYGVLPRYRQLRVGYTLSNKRTIGILAGLGLLIVVSYIGNLLLQNTERSSLGTLHIGRFPIYFTQVTVELIQLGAVLSVVAIFFGVFAKDTVRIRNESFLLSTMRSLFNKGEHATLVDLIKDNYAPLIDHPTKPTAPGDESFVEVLSSIDVDEGSAVDVEVNDSDDTDGEDRRSGLRKRIQARTSAQREQAKYRWRQLQYRLADTAEEASGYTETLLLDSEFTGEHPILDPDLGIQIILHDDLDGFRRQDVVHQYLTTLLQTENSLLYRDISNNMTMDSIYRYRIDPDNRLLHALLSDCSRVEDLDAYKPIGDTTQEILREHEKEDYDKYHSQRLTSSNLSNDYIFTDPVFVGITFFDIMIRESFYQRIDWHMWLYYYDSITRLICENYEITEESDPDSEWPNDYSRFLYEMVDNMTNLLRIMEKMVREDEFDITPEEDNDQEHAEFIKLESFRRDEGGNIPKSAVIILFSCHQEILTTTEIPHQFKEYITKILFRVCSDLREHDEGTLPWKYSEFMLYRLEEEMDDRQHGVEYRYKLESVYEDGVRNEVIASGVTGGSIVDELDDLIRTSS